MGCWLSLAFDYAQAPVVVGGCIVLLDAVAERSRSHCLPQPLSFQVLAAQGVNSKLVRLDAIA